MLLLTEGHVTVLGGSVDQLVQENNPLAMLNRAM